jgi:hypothetical protein
MPAPAWTYNSVGNALASVTLNHSGALQTFTVDWSGVMAGQLQIENAGGGTVASTAGCQVSIYRVFTTNNDNQPVFQFTIPTLVSTNNFQSIEMSSGKYFVTLKNLDTTNDVTVVATTSTLSWPS